MTSLDPCWTQTTATTQPSITSSLPASSLHEPPAHFTDTAAGLLAALWDGWLRPSSSQTNPYER